VINGKFGNNNSYIKKHLQRVFPVIENIKLDGIITLLTFGAMFLGGNLIQLLIHYTNNNSHYIQILCGGLLTGIFAFDIIPDAFSHFKTLGVLMGIAIGIFIMVSIDIFLHKKSAFYMGDQGSIYLLLFALLFHSIPTGVTFGMSLQQGHLINFGLLFAFIFHHIPEGIIISTSIPDSKGKNNLFTAFCLILSIVIGVNIFWGLNLRVDSVKWNPVMMGITIGTMGYVTFYELLWKKSKKLPKGKVAIIVILGMIGVHYFLQYLPSHP